MTAKRLIGTAVLGLVLLATACTTTGEIEGHRIRGVEPTETPVEKAAREFWEDVGAVLFRRSSDHGFPGLFRT
ncbi:MAG: hypothetical protein OXP75_20055, partial [Rhodospirillales bacterium]|nr:hypothetical protein [Rhodospirillales bacterium]